MKKYTITIEEMVSKDFEVIAKNMGEALEIAERKYRDGEFVLDPGNLVCKQILAKDGNGDFCEWYEL